jgi:hypothetical protein
MYIPTGKQRHTNDDDHKSQGQSLCRLKTPARVYTPPSTMARAVCSTPCTPDTTRAMDTAFSHRKPAEQDG